MWWACTRTPTAPNRPLLLTGVLIVGILGGIGSAFAMSKLQATFPTAQRLEIFILSAGGSEEPDALYTKFRGKMPGVEPLLKGRGLLDVA